MRTRRKAGKATPANLHQHKDSTVSRGELDNFGDEEVEVQLEVLASLRVNAARQDSTHLLALISLGISVLAILLVYASGSLPHPSPAPTSPGAP